MGGPAGFLKVVDEHTIAYADFRGNVQYISAGNIESDGRVALILVDYARRRRLKIWGHASLVNEDTDPALIARLRDVTYAARGARCCHPCGRLRLELSAAHHAAIHRGGDCTSGGVDGKGDFHATRATNKRREAMTATESPRPPLPPFTRDTAEQKVRMAEDAI